MVPSIQTTDYDAFRHLRGAYVDCAYDVRDLQNGELPPGLRRLAKPDIRWRRMTAEGILGFTRGGFPKFGNEPYFADPYRKVANVVMTERFRPARNAVKFLCRECGDPRPRARRSPLSVKPHAIAVQLDVARIRLELTSGASFTCSICGASGRLGVYRVPSFLWWVTPDTPDAIVERELAGLQFDRVMRDATMRLALISCRAPFRPGGPFHSQWQSSRGEFVNCEHEAPPPAGWWERWMPIEELKECVASIIAQGGHVLHPAQGGPGA
jgi:hypothetical protein